MEGWGQISSQPSNYVSILHLRERWLKENERNQKEKEEQKQLEQQEQQQKVQRTEPEKKDDQKLEDSKRAVQKPRIKAISWSRNGSGKFQRYYRAKPASDPRNVKETCKKTKDEGEPLLAAPRIEKDEKEKKSRRKGRKKNPSAPKEEMERTSPTPQENLKEEMPERECKVGGRENVWVRKIDEEEGIGGSMWT